MSDDAAVWKVGFGVLVLALCGFTAMLHKHPAPPPPAATVTQPRAAVPLPDAAPPQQKDDPAPPLEAAIDDSRVQQARAFAKPQARPPRHLFASATSAPPHARRFVPPRIHRVVATRPQYPFDPRERWNPRF